MNQKQQNEEMNQRTIAALRQVVRYLSPDDLALLCWHCGVQPKELINEERKAA